ncbi:DUF262 domain-containing protein [Flavimobilis rhizosphaerae]|uniref:DUF262 domain-containing protein n=1 Tax=Flavimobilis rhizosphaerae TaxID=2775421 RepID=UPI001B3552F8|nr:DUF262 domain-containing protein [Flavimobilis rhizosphaerae]
MNDGYSAASLGEVFAGTIDGRFFVPSYQRGYRWGTADVLRLLDDVWTSEGDRYYLQPIVVKPAGDDRWELIDGQQRLTTLHLIMHFMQRTNLQNQGPGFSLEYETRPGSEAFLSEVDVDRAGENIDYFHMAAAYRTIEQWFDAHGTLRQYVANKFYTLLFERVVVIWYQASAYDDSTDLFTRLNVGRIPLTDSELVKALVLAKTREVMPGTGRAEEIAAQWDMIERQLQRPEVWGFAAGGLQPPSTRIDFLLDAMAGGPTGRDRPRYFTFETLRARIDPPEGAPRPLAFWQDVLDIHATMMWWFEDRSLFHKVGYLMYLGEPFHELIELAAELPKSEFDDALTEKISSRLDLSEDELGDIGYEHRASKCADALLLMNIETARTAAYAHARYSFSEHHAQRWSLEHIHAQNAEPLRRAEQWRTWLVDHRAALDGLDAIDGAQRERAIAEVDRALEDLTEASFRAAELAVTRLLTAESGGGDDVHGLANLALLTSGDNAALSNAVFEVKRRTLIERDRQGAYVPPATRQVFLKYFTDADAQQPHLWTETDRAAYLDAIRNTLRPYLRTTSQGAEL